MLVEGKFLKHATWVGGLALAMMFSPNAQADSITAQLNCNLNYFKDNGVCDGGPSFGSINIDDAVIGGDIKITVSLSAAGLKFSDMMLAFDGDATGLTETDPNNTVVLDLGFFDLGPAGGIGGFDIGDKGNGPGGGTTHGWDGGSSYFVFLTGVGDTLTVADFLNAVDDDKNALSVALHLQSVGDGTGGGNCSYESDPACIPGSVGGGSLFLGGTFREDGDIPDVPEPSTILLMGGALLGLGYLRKRRNS